MGTTLSESRVQLARACFEKYPDHDQVRDWYEAGHEIVKTHAYFRRNSRFPTSNGESDQGDQHDWFIAEQTIAWRMWAETNLSACLIPGVLRPYLALAAGTASNSLSQQLNSICELGPHLQAAGFLAVLDGAPECAQHHSERHLGNGVAWDDINGAKDGTFFEYCRDTLALHRGKIIEGGKLRPCREIVEQDRAFEDGCLGCFQGASAGCDAITAALRLRSFLVSQNYRQELPWQDQLHPRIVVASTWDMAMRGLLLARRGDIVVEDVLFSPLGDCAKRTLLADGIRLAQSFVK